MAQHYEQSWFSTSKVLLTPTEPEARVHKRNCLEEVKAELEVILGDLSDVVEVRTISWWCLQPFP